MPRKALPVDDEKRSYGALWLLCSLLLLVGALWAIADDNIFRRPWKKWQAGVNPLEMSKLEGGVRAGQARPGAGPGGHAGAQAPPRAQPGAAPRASPPP